MGEEGGMKTVGVSWFGGASTHKTADCVSSVDILAVRFTVSCGFDVT